MSRLTLPARCTLLVLSALLSACGGGGSDESSTTTPTAPAAPTTPSTPTTPTPPLAGTGPDPTSDPQGRISSAAVLAQARENGAISREQEILFSVFAQFGDSRLPAQYRGDDSAVLEPSSLTDAAEYLASVGVANVSSATRDALHPYFDPPYYQGSAWQQSSGSSAPGQKTAQAVTAAAPTKLGWIAVTGTNVVVWYRTGNGGDAGTAATLVAEYDNTIWPKLTTLMGRSPKSDLGSGGLLSAGVAFTEDDGRLDVFLDDMATGEGLTVPITNTLGGRTKDVPARIFLKRTLPPHGLLAQAAHEFMHAIQYSYDMKGAGLNSYLTLKEATATWASYYVYNNKWETQYAKYYLGRNQHAASYDSRPTDKHFHYGAYVLPLFLEKRFGASIVKSIWDNTLTYAEELATLEGAIVGAGSNFREEWRKFVAASWNQETLNTYAAANVTDFPVAISITDASLQNGFGYFGHEVGIPHASLVYHRIDFTNPTVRSITFVNGINYGFDTLDEGAGTSLHFTGLDSNRRRGISMQLYLKVNGVWQTAATDFTNYPSFSVCRDDPAGKVESAIFMYGNAETLATMPNYAEVEVPVLAPGLVATDIGCRDWTGSLSFTRALDNGRDGTEKMTISNITMKNVMPTAAPTSTDEVVPYVLAPGESAPAGYGFAYATQSGSATWSYHATTAGPTVCQYDGTKTFSVAGPERPLFVFTNWTPPGTAFRRAIMPGLLSNAIPALVTRTIDWTCTASDGTRTTGTDGPNTVLDFFVDFHTNVQISAGGLSISGTGAQSIEEYVTGAWSFTGKTQ